MSAESVTPDSNTSSPIVFATYFLTPITLLFLTTTSIQRSYSRLSAHQKRNLSLSLPITIFLALSGLAITCHHMLRFLAVSYQSWAAASQANTGETIVPITYNLSPSVLFNTGVELDAWLSDTQLFHELWATSIETLPRVCWSLPKFFIMAGWSFYIAREGMSALSLSPTSSDYLFTFSSATRCKYQYLKP